MINGCTEINFSKAVSFPYKNVYTVCNFIFNINGEKFMSRLHNLLVAATLSITATAALAGPKLLITHNQTDLESNAFIAGTIPSTHPTKAHSDNKVSWISVEMACFGHTTADKKCSALIKMATNSAYPIDIGTVVMDLSTGDITPKQINANGYTLIVNGPGETTIVKN